MPQLANVVLTDAATTPVAFTFVPSNISNGVASLINTSGVPVGNKNLTVSMTKTGTGKYKAVYKLSVPIVQTQTVNGVSTPIVVRTGYAEVTFNFEPTSTTQERKDLVSFTRELFSAGNGVTYTPVVNLEGIY